MQTPPNSMEMVRSKEVKMGYIGAQAVRVAKQSYHDQRAHVKAQRLEVNEYAHRQA